MNKTTIKWAANHSTAQIYNSGVELALCSDDNHQIGTFVFCKDFFQDAIVVFLHGGVCGIYGYSYDPKTMPPCPQKNLKVLIANAGDAKFNEKAQLIPGFVNQIEDKLGTQKTIVEECENPPDKYKKCGVYLLTADKIWMLAPPLLSMWTLLARNGIQHTADKPWDETVKGIIDGRITPAQKNDHTYLTYAKPGIDLLLEKGFEPLFGKDQTANYPKDKAGSIMHHYSGAVSYGSCKAKSYFPNWLYPSVETNPPHVCFS